MEPKEKLTIVYAPPSAYYGGVSETTRAKRSTVLGEMELSPTERDHVYLNAHSGCLNTDTGLWLHDRKYGVYAHAYRHSDGLWRLYPEGTAQWEIDRAPYVVIPGGRDASKSIKKKFRQAITRAVNAWAEENEAALEAAEKKHLEEARNIRKEELSKLRDRANQLEYEIIRIEAGEHLPTYPEGNRYRG